MSYKPAVKVSGNGDAWSYNGLRFATHAEALASAQNLMGRWMLVTDCAAHESVDAPNYRLDDDGQVTEIPKAPRGWDSV